MPKSEVKKFIIWGNALHSHTHSYIHYGFYKALKSLGHEVYWFDDVETNFNFENSIIITQSNCIKNLPIISSAKYFIHNICEGFQKQTLIDHDNVYNLLVYHEEYNFPDNLQSLDDYSWYDSETKNVMIMWGTDLLPEEIDNMQPVLYDQSKSDINFIGTIQGENAINFAHICADHGKNFYNLGGYTGSSQNDNSQFYDNSESVNSLRKSYLSFDIREEQHLRNGYVPCRVFKNISYGMWTGSNSTKIKKFFNGHLTINNNLSELYDDLVSDYSSCTEERIRNSMNYVRDNHTYLNRVQSLLSVL